MSEKFDTTASRLLHQGYRDSDFKQLLDEVGRLSVEAEMLRAWGSRRDEEMQHQAKLAAQWRDAGDALAGELFDNLPPNIESPALVSAYEPSKNKS